MKPWAKKAVEYLAVLIVVLGVCGILCATHRSAWRYRMTHDPRSLYKVLHEKVRNGDSHLKVKLLLGQLLPADVPDWRERIAARLPDGALPSDRLYFLLCTGDGAVMLQFRTNDSGQQVLVNHDPERYRKYEKHVLSSG